MIIYCEPAGGRPLPAGAAPDRATEGTVRRVHSLAEVTAGPDADTGPDLVIVGPGVPLPDALDFAARHRIHRPALGVVLVRDTVSVDVLADAIRAGVREVVPGDDPVALRLACERSLDVSHRIGASVAPSPPAVEVAKAATVVTVFGGKGGCGKSTVATNLAVALAAGGRCRTLLMDLDLQFGDVGIMLQLNPERGVADAIGMAGRLDDEGLRSMLTRYQPGLDVLLAPPGPVDADHVSRDLVTELLAVARTTFDFVVVDTPPFFNDPVLAALDVTDWFVLPVTPDLPTLKSVRVTMDMFDLLEYPADRRLAVLNRADSQVGLTVANIEKAVGLPMSVLVPSSRDVPMSVNRGVPLALDNPAHPVSRAIRDLAGRCGGPDSGGPDSGGPARSRRTLLTRGRRR